MWLREMQVVVAEVEVEVAVVEIGVMLLVHFVMLNVLQHDIAMHVVEAVLWSKRVALWCGAWYALHNRGFCVV